VSAGIDVGEPVAQIVDPSDVAALALAGERGYDCVVCERPGRLPDDPAALVVLVDGPVQQARLAHRACSASAVVNAPGLAASIGDRAVTAVAAVLPHANGPRPVITVETWDRVAHRAEFGDRVDAVLSALLGQGLHLVARLGRTPPASPGWRVLVSCDGTVQITGPDGAALYDGELVLPGAWLQLAAAVKSCLLLVGTGLQLRNGLGGVAAGMTMLNGAARDGRLIGGVVDVAVV
jgi:hypothetical protein